ncbi:MAG: hypothetical protein ABI207_09380 [Crocinitomicaceae bacterium]
MKLILIILISFFNGAIIAQEIPLSKKIIEKIFNQNEKGRTHGFKKKELDQYGGEMISKYDSWYALEKDNTDKNLDTIKLYNHSGYLRVCDCR